MTEKHTILLSLNLEQRRAFLDQSFLWIEAKMESSNDPNELNFLKWFQDNYLKAIYDVETIPILWISQVFYLYNNPKYPLFLEWLTTLPDTVEAGHSE